MLANGIQNYQQIKIQLIKEKTNILIKCKIQLQLNMIVLKNLLILKNSNYLLQQQDNEAFPQISSFGKHSSSQIDQGDSQSSSSIHQQEQSIPSYQNGQRNVQEQMINLQAGYSLQNQISMQKTTDPKLGDNQNNLLSGSTQSQTPEIQNQQTIYLQQQLQQQQQQAVNHPIQQQQQNHNIINIFKPAEYTLQQPQQQQQNISQQTLLLHNQHPYSIYSPIYYSCPPSQSSTPIPYQPSQQGINYPNNYDSKLNNSLKTLATQELSELITHLESQIKNYQDYLYLAKSEDQKRKIEGQMQQNNQNMNPNTLNIHAINSATNGSNYSNPHSNSSLAN